MDPASPEHGKRRLLQWYFREKEGVFWRPNTLAVMPAYGYPLRPSTRYAVVVTTRAKSADGGIVRASDDLIEVLGLVPATPRTEAVRKAYAPAIAELAKAGIAPKQIANVSVFTTNDPTSELFRITDFVKSSYPAPTFDAGKWEMPVTKGAFDLYAGEYGPSPDFQAGMIPFEQNGQGGELRLRSGRQAHRARKFTLRGAIAVPHASRCPMPAAGYPIVLYAHGTGGDYESFIARRHGGGAREAVRRVHGHRPESSTGRGPARRRRTSRTARGRSRRSSSTSTTRSRRARTAARPPST